MNVSNYNHREKGQIHIKPDKWLKIADILEVHVDDIYETDEKYTLNCKDQSVGIAINNGTNNVYTVPKHLLDSLHKYINMLEEKIKDLERK